MGIARTPQDVGYFNWLCRRVWLPEEGNTYDGLLIQLYETEFVWVIGNDGNRIEDASDLRRKYDGKATGISRKISFLEVLIALSERFGFMVDRPPKDLAWDLIKNLKLNEYPDPIDGPEWNKVRDILEAVIWRTYAPDGRGGFFPLEHPKEDQTAVELWYQMSQYVQENREAFDL